MKRNRTPTRGLRWGPLLAGCLTLSALSTAQADALLDQGKQIYTQGVSGTPACVTCHGARGEGSAAANFPYLAGQGGAYLEEQLKALADGSRQNPIMKPIASALSEPQRHAVATYAASLPRPWDAAQLAAKAQTYPDGKDTGAWLANRGDWSKQVPACTQCHAAGGIGVGSQFPAIAGLSKTYIIEQFNLWRHDQRPAGPGQVMGNIAKRLAEPQIEAVATYFAGLPQAAVPQASGATP
ncbi:MAG: c-type cytochrome [Castellaniella sp.]|nr:c-type cytochrome [Castellaniella sp.]